MFTKVKILPLSNEVKNQTKKLRLLKKVKNKIRFLEQNFRHPSLRTKLLKPHHRGIWQIYITKKYRAFFIVKKETVSQTAEVEFIFVGDPHR